MSNISIHSGLSDRSAKPRQNLDPSMRRKVHGPIRPMDEPSLLARLFRWN